MKRIAILGPGLLGGSIALKLRRLAGFHVSLWARRPEAVAEVIAAGCADAATTDLSLAVGDADLVVLCVPVGAMGELARAMVPSIRPDTIVTDVGSVKGRVQDELSTIFRGCGRFVGSHPMAGSEHVGLKAARADLFDRATCIITPDRDTEPSALGEVTEFWQRLGCRVVELPASEHDECVALVSHLPHLVAATLVNTVAARNPHAFQVVGPGFRDSSRVASGPPGMWTEILKENTRAVIEATDALIANLNDFRQILARPDGAAELHGFLAAAKAIRDRTSFPKTNNG
jgi:prephenate dehydrogenase